MGGRYFNFNCSFIDIMTPNKQPECVECTEHEMIREGSIHQIKAMNCRVKPSDPVFFDTTATEQPEWERAFEVQFTWLADGANDDIKNFIKQILSSRDTYWMERVRDIIKMADELEHACGKDGDKGLEQWKAFKGFRNAIRDKYLTPPHTEEKEIIRED